MCQYEDHCRVEQHDCDCCVFQHCHCRSICPSKCRCYFDSSLSQNIIDCSQSNLIDVPSEQPIESATDMRLNSNNLKMLKAYAFFGYGSIKYLYLQDNQISALHRNALDDLKPTLRLVNLANNHLDYLHGDEFRGFSELEVIVLSNNPLKQIESIGFLTTESLPKLKHVYATKTKLSAEQFVRLKTNSNATFKYKEKRLGTTTLLNNVEASIDSDDENKMPELPPLTGTINETWTNPPIHRSPAYPFSFLPIGQLTNNIYLITGLIITVCLALSLVILACVLCVVKRIERGRRARKRSSAGQTIKTQLPSSYFTPVVDDDSASSSSSDEDSDTTSSSSSR